MKKIVQTAVIGVFLLALSIPFLTMSTGLYVEKNEENRTLAPKVPVYDVKGYEAYFNDHFGFRRELVSLCSLWKGITGNRLISKEVLKGKDGWLFYTTDNADFDPIATYQGKNLYDAERLQTICGNLQKITDDLREKNIRFLVVIPPNKCTVYPEYLPDAVRIPGEQTRLDQIKNYLADHSTVDFLDVRPLFAEKKKGDTLYYKTDTHWNEYGAYFAAQEILSHLGLHTDSLEDYSVEKSTVDGKDLARMAALSHVVMDDMVSVRPKNGFQAVPTAGELDTDKIGVFEKKMDAPSMMIYRDSFTVAMFPFLAEHFQKSVSNWSFHIKESDIEAYRPDIVILEILERNIPFLETMTLEK